MGIKKNRVGEIHRSNDGYDWEIIEYSGCYKVKIKLLGYDYTKILTYGHLKDGKIKNPYSPSVYGVGFIGVGIHPCMIDGVTTNCYRTWRNMIRRCFDSKFQKNQPAYIGAKIFEDWLNFQTFGDWFEENHTDGYDLDKDILSRGEKVYSPETSLFIPRRLNAHLITWNFDCVSELPNGNFRVVVMTSNKQICHGAYSTYNEALKVALAKKKENTTNLINELLKKNEISKHIYDSVLGFIDYKNQK